VLGLLVITVLTLMVHNLRTSFDAALDTAGSLQVRFIECEGIETGKLADLLLVDGNPLDDLSVLADRARIHMVIQGGTIVVDRRP
jgi:hypothetical protein